MQLAQRVVRRSRNNRTTLNRKSTRCIVGRPLPLQGGARGGFARPLGPLLPQPRKRNRCPIRPMNVKRFLLPPPAPRLLPLVESIRRNDAPPTLYGIAKRRFLAECLRTRINHRRTAADFVRGAP